MSTKKSKSDPVYQTWCNMRQRCTNPNHPEYSRYGGRGIKICGRWDDFDNFQSDLGPRPQGMTLDRKNNDGDYEPDNCRWATPLEQAANRRPPPKRGRIARRKFYSGKCVHEWADIWGLTYSGAYLRIRRLEAA